MAIPLLKAAETPTKVDPVTFEVLRNLFEYTCERMTTILQKASFSPILADMLDFSNAIYDPELRLLSQAANCPVHLAAMQFSAREAVKRFGIETMKEGEIFVLNDPYAGGTHLNDITFTMPVTTRFAIASGIRTFHPSRISWS